MRLYAALQRNSEKSEKSFPTSHTHINIPTEKLPRTETNYMHMYMHMYMRMYM